MRGCLQAAVFSNFLNFGGYIEVTVGLFRMSLHKLRPEYCTAENKKSHFFPRFYSCSSNTREQEVRKLDSVELAFVKLLA